MIEESLLKSNYIGKDGFNWWIGRVADAKVWKGINLENSFNGDQAFRCKVRIIGHHPFDNTIKENDLPWAVCLMDATGGNGMGGQSKTFQMEGGETCVGFFMDGEDGQQPVIIGLLHRHANVKSSIDQKTIDAEQSSQFKNAPLYIGNNVPATNRLRPTTTPISPATASTGIGATTDKKIPSAYIAGISQAQAQVEREGTNVSRKPSNCGNDLIGSITRILQDFIAGISILENAFGQFVDPILNKIVDVASQIQNVASQIGGIIKLIINNIRSGIFKCIVSLFKKFLALLFKTDPTSPVTGPIAKKATKTILDKLFCIFENLIDEIIDFVVNMLTNMIGNIVNPSLCVAEQFVSGILAKLMDMIEKAIQPILSGISWLTGGISSITSILQQASTLASQIYSFIGDCGGLKCTQPSEWVSSWAVAMQKASDNWENQIKNIDILGGISNDLSQISNAIGGDGQLQTAGGYVNSSQLTGILQTANALGGGLNTIEGAIATISGFGNVNGAFGSCGQSSLNPQTQDDLATVPFGYQYEYCIPPIARVYGSGVGANLIPIVAKGSIFSIEIISGGVGYTSPLPIAIVDNSGYGSGAKAEAIVENGVITGAVVIYGGSGYCGGNYSNIGIGTTTNAGIGSTVVGVVTSIYIPNPGLGYTSGDTISIGTTTIKPLITPNGSIVQVNVPKNYNQTFENAPPIIINTSTGVGAKLIPVMKFTPQGATLNQNVNQNQVISVVDCV
jgi:methyl-accepting chemotaxis protein